MNILSFPISFSYLCASCSWYETLIEYPDINKEAERQKKKKRGVFPMLAKVIYIFIRCCWRCWKATSLPGEATSFRFKCVENVMAFFQWSKHINVSVFFLTVLGGGGFHPYEFFLSSWEPHPCEKQRCQRRRRIFSTGRWNTPLAYDSSSP